MSYLRTGVKGCSKIRRVLAKPRLILDEMCRLCGKFASYLRRVLCNTRLIFPRINGPNVLQRHETRGFQIMVIVAAGKSCIKIVSYFTTLNYSRSLLLRYGKIDRAWGGGNCNRFPIQTRIFSKERVGEGGPFHLPPWRWSETERRGSVQRHLLLPLGIQGPVHLHTLAHETCYFNVLASRFDFEYCK